jgi:hypothetical protein
LILLQSYQRQRNKSLLRRQCMSALKVTATLISLIIISLDLSAQLPPTWLSAKMDTSLKAQSPNRRHTIASSRPQEKAQVQTNGAP